MLVGDICSRHVDVARPGETVREAARRMQQRNVGCLVVVDGSQAPAGIVTDRDLLLRAVAAARDPDSTPLSEVMTPEPRRIREDALPREALAFMSVSTVRRLPVVDGENRLVGIVSLDDILRYLARDMETISDILANEGPSTLA